MLTRFVTNPGVQVPVLPLGRDGWECIGAGAGCPSLRAVSESAAASRNAELKCRSTLAQSPDGSSSCNGCMLPVVEAHCAQWTTSHRAPRAAGSPRTRQGTSGLTLPSKGHTTAGHNRALRHGRRRRCVPLMSNVRRHMYRCPSCNQRTIGYFRKWLSYPAIPARCPSCGTYSHGHRASGGLGFVISAVVITLCGFLSVSSDSPWPILFGVLSSFAYYLWHWHRVRLEPLAPEAVAAARRSESAFGLVALLSIFLN